MTKFSAGDKIRHQGRGATVAFNSLGDPTVTVTYDDEADGRPRWQVTRHVIATDACELLTAAVGPRRLTQAQLQHASYHNGDGTVLGCGE